MRAFLAEKGADCASPKLKEAAKVTDTATAVAATMKPEYAAMLEAGAAVLDVADGAKKKGCARNARELYDFVLRNFPAWATPSCASGQRSASRIFGHTAKPTLDALFHTNFAMILSTTDVSH